MRNFLTFAIALMMTFTLSAQESERKLLSIEDVVLNRELSPKTFPVQWVGQSDSYSTVEGETLVATDAHRLVRYTNGSVKGSQAVSFILPKKPAQLLKQVLQKEAEEVKVTFGQKNAKFEFGSTVMICRQIEGRFPNYNAVIPQNNTNKVLVDRQTIVNACKRVAVFANTGTSLLKLALSENKIKISAQDIDFSTSAEETISCDYSGMPMAIGFKAPFLIEILSNVASQEVVLQLADPARAGLILPAENEEGQDLLILLMPMLLND